MNILIALIATLGAITAALIAGFFSYANLVSSKENKVSEFRLTWINGLREEIAEYTSATQDLARLNSTRSSITNEQLQPNRSIEERRIEWSKLTGDSYKKAVLNISKIQLRLNPDSVTNSPDSDEAKLFAAVIKAKDLLNTQQFKEAIACSTEIREAAAPLLKKTWVIVRDGESGYQKTRNAAKITISAVFVLIIAAYILALVATWTSKTNNSPVEQTPAIQVIHNRAS